MKEKTFNDLLKPHQKRFDYYNSQRIFIDKADVIKLLHQVREATIAEVLTLCDDNFFSKEPKGKLMENIENLPTDRIKTEK